jgi:hypothetical protein
MGVSSPTLNWDVGRGKNVNWQRIPRKGLDIWCCKDVDTNGEDLDTNRE